MVGLRSCRAHGGHPPLCLWACQCGGGNAIHGPGLPTLPIKTSRRRVLGQMCAWWLLDEESLRGDFLADQVLMRHMLDSGGRCVCCMPVCIGYAEHDSKKGYKG